MCKYCKAIQREHFSKPVEGDLRVWWIPQVPMEPFYYPVKNTDEAVLVLKSFAQYDLFQCEHNVKPDYSNVGGLEIYDLDTNGEGEAGWIEWCNDDGDDIDEVIDTEE